MTATIYYQGYPLDDFGEPDTEAGIQIMEWTDAADYGEVNPQTTDAFGQYGWDVIPGQWQVRFSKDGYQPLETDWMEVPPEYFDVNMNLQTTTPPEVKSAEAYPDSVRVEFTQYMRIDNVTSGAISVKADGVPVNGTVSASNAEYDYERLNQYASVFLFTPDETMSGEVSVAVQGAANYAGIVMQDAYQVGASVTPKPETLSVEEIAAISHHGETTLTVKILPAEADANRTVRVHTSSSLIASPESDTLTTDASGQATLKVTGNLPGSARLTFTLDGTDLTAETQIAVASLLSGVCADVTASVTPGTVAKGTSVILACATEGATIYYTLDGSSAANADNPARQVYASPIVLEKDTRIRACAEKADCLVSEEASFSYRMEAAPVTEYAPGDVDGDGTIGMKDLSLLRRYLNGWSVEVVPEAMDTDGDGNVTMKDFSVLRRYLNGWPVTLGGNNAAA